MTDLRPGDTVLIGTTPYTFVEHGCATRQDDCPNGDAAITVYAESDRTTYCLDRDAVTAAPRMGYVYDGTGPLFDAGETICSVHAEFRDGYRPDHWSPATDDGTCFICAEDANIAAGEKRMNA